MPPKVASAPSLLLEWGRREDNWPDAKDREFGSLLVTEQEAARAVPGVTRVLPPYVRLRHLIYGVVAAAKNCNRFLFIVDACHSTLPTEEQALLMKELRSLDKNKDKDKQRFLDTDDTTDATDFDKGVVWLMSAAAKRQVAKESRSRGFFSGGIQEAFKTLLSTKPSFAVKDLAYHASDNVDNLSRRTQKSSCVKLIGVGEFPLRTVDAPMSAVEQATGHRGVDYDPTQPAQQEQAGEVEMDAGSSATDAAHVQAGPALTTGVFTLPAAHTLDALEPSDEQQWTRTTAVLTPQLDLCSSDAQMPAQLEAMQVSTLLRTPMGTPRLASPCTHVSWLSVLLACVAALCSAASYVLAVHCRDRDVCQMEGDTHFEQKGEWQRKCTLAGAPLWARLQAARCVSSRLLARVVCVLCR